MVLKIPTTAVAIIFLVAANGSAVAGESPNNRLIIDVGCHHDNGTCFITLDGTAFGSSLGCSAATSNEFRFDDGDTANGRRTYASLLAAFMTKKHVSVYLNGCTVQSYPKLVYFHVTD